MNNFGLIASRFHGPIVEQLVKGALQTLASHDAQGEIIWVPGALEIPIVAQRAARTRKYNALICLGAVIKNATDHYEHVCHEVHRGVTRVSLDASLPITMGVLTVHNLEQALERSGDNSQNVGSQAANAALEVVRILDTINE